MSGMLRLVCHLAHAVVWACAHSLGRRNKQIVTLHGEGAGVPVSGNQANVTFCVDTLVRGEACHIKYSNGVNARVGYEKTLAIVRLRQCRGTETNSDILLSLGSAQLTTKSSGLSVNHCHHIGV